MRPFCLVINISSLFMDSEKKFNQFFCSCWVMSCVLLHNQTFVYIIYVDVKLTSLKMSNPIQIYILFKGMRKNESIVFGNFSRLFLSLNFYTHAQKTLFCLKIIIIHNFLHLNNCRNLNNVSEFLISKVKILLLSSVGFHLCILQFFNDSFPQTNNPFKDSVKQTSFPLK
jgi:hypothetical protein